MPMIEKTAADRSTMGSWVQSCLAKGLRAVRSRLVDNRAAPRSRDGGRALKATYEPTAPVRMLRADIEEIYWAMAHDIPVPTHMFER